MRRLTLLVLLGAMPATLLAQPTDREQQREWLLQQIRLGEVTHRESLVEDSLARLRLLEPNNLDAITASIRQALRTHEIDRARQLYGDLQRIAPGSPQERQMARLLEMHSGDGEQALQQIRLLATAGRFDEALARYEAAFGKDEPPSLELAMEYWRIRSRLPDQLPTTIEHLRALDKQYPGSPELQQFLAEQLFRAKRNDEALALLHRMAGESQSRGLAAELEYAYLSKQPVSDASVKAWQAFLARYPGDSHAAQVQETLDGQLKLTGDPAWRAGQQGIALLTEKRAPAEAERKLRQALAAYPKDATLKGYLGLALVRQGRRQEALDWLKQAVAEEQNTYILSKWHDLLASTEYWLGLQRGKQALAARNYDAAQQAYQQAAQQDPKEVMAVIGLGNVALARGQRAQAEGYYQQALRMDPGNDGATRGLARLYQGQSAQRYAQFLATLPAKQRQAYARPQGGGGGGGDPQLERLRKESAVALERRDWPAATALLRQARERAPNDPWLAADLARALREQGRQAEADAVFAELIARQGDNPQARFAYGLYLESTGRYQAALDNLQRVPQSSWNDGMRQLDQRLQRQASLERARSLYASGDSKAAMALLEQRIASTDDPRQKLDDLRQLAGWARQRQDLEAADGYYVRILALQPADGDARLGRIEAQIARGDSDAARQALLSDPPRLEQGSYDARRRLANAWAAVGEKQRAATLLAALAKEHSEPDPLLYRDLAQLQPHSNAEQALDYYALGMRDAGLLSAAQASPRDDIALTTASRAKDDDDWLKRSLRSEVDRLYQWQSPTVTIHQDYGWRDNDGASGISDLTTSTTMVHAEMPVGEGRGFARVEQVALRASSFDTDADGLHREAYGSCSFRGNTASGPVATGCPGGSESADGTTLALGWQNDRLSADIGTSPLGFEEQNILGGVTYSGKTWGTGWSLSASRRPLNNSLLSYAGAKDPRTGVSWGGVTATGATLGLSRDQGGVDGTWASLGYHLLRGDNVKDNSRFRAMGGYYYRLIQRVDEELRVGTTAMYWTYERNLGGYTLGQGGYYSPQRYYSFGVPVSYAWRNPDWSIYLEGSLGYSWAHSDAERAFPVNSVNDDILAQYPPLVSSNIGELRGGDDNKGVGYLAQALAERRLDDHWVLGGGFTAQRSKDYAPNRVLLYLRYSFDPWQGNLPLPVNPLKPYADFR
ncbi:cellulose synthase complex outer membrane protein BcsC [Pseudomonas citronellolis]|uniref:cellulose synthase complex outer membrane protein BcsC n=1 Tax=Pseudomonas citronellolis TaxID=53408 RepID=UPI0023E3BC3F|nr:cellulose synthase complex outer membrane protein BcsC [Pseudomonas citronellolis]MDF3934422.1 cellulose synthase complex outer membrane protein BcsC [Pseudomonas citronellolis]